MVTETLADDSDLDVVVRSVLLDATVRHQPLGRAGQWLDDPAHEFGQRARDDIGRVKERL